MLSVKQLGIKYHFKSFWYDSTWDWTKVSRAIGEHSNHYANDAIMKYSFEFLKFILKRIKAIIKAGEEKNNY